MAFYFAGTTHPLHFMSLSEAQRTIYRKTEVDKTGTTKLSKDTHKLAIMDIQVDEKIGQYI